MNDDVDGYNNIPLLGIYSNNSKESEEVGNLTISVADPAWDKIETLVQETVNNNGYFAFVVNGDEWGDINFENNVLSKDWISIDLTNETIDVGTEPLASFDLKGYKDLPFMAFNKVDAYTYEDNGTVNVYEGINYQLYSNGEVHKSYPYIEYKQQGSSAPILTTAILNDNNSNNIFSLTNMENSGFIDGDGNFHYQLFSEESPLTYATGFVADAQFNWEVQAVDAFGGSGGSVLTAMSGSSWTYVLEGGPDKF